MSTDAWLTLVIGSAGITGLTAAAKFALEFTRPSRIAREINRLAEVRDALPEGRSRSNMDVLAEAAADELACIARKKIRGRVLTKNWGDWLFLSLDLSLLYATFAAPYSLYQEGMVTESRWAFGLFFVAFLASGAFLQKRVRPRRERSDRIDAWLEAEQRDVFEAKNDDNGTEEPRASAGDTSPSRPIGT